MPSPGRPIHIVAVLPSPIDGAQWDAAAIWQDLQNALQPLIGRDLVRLERLEPPTENALKERLAKAEVHTLHFVGMGKSRPSARYEALVFESSGRRRRNVTAQYLGGLLSRCDSLRLVILQPSSAQEPSLEGAAQQLAAEGLPAVLTTGPLSNKSRAVFAAKLYAGLALGRTLEEATRDARHALLATERVEGPDGQAVILTTASPAARLVEVSTVTEVAPAAADSAAADSSTAVAAEVVSQAALSAQLELARKRQAGTFDVFLCHNRADKPAVKDIARQLQERGILPWLDEWELPPGQSWQPLLEEQIGSIGSAAVFVGSAGIGPWQEQELYSFLREFVSRKSPVIPVLLPDAPETPELPIFLRSMTWVDFRTRDPSPLLRLIWGITGQRPPDW